MQHARKKLNHGGMPIKIVFLFLGFVRLRLGRILRLLLSGLNLGLFGDLRNLGRIGTNRHESRRECDQPQQQEPTNPNE